MKKKELKNELKRANVIIENLRESYNLLYDRYEQKCNELNTLVCKLNCIVENPSDEYFFKNIVFDEKEKTTQVTFTDGDVVTCKCAKGDKFSKEIGVAICVAKKSLKDDKTTIPSIVKEFSRDKNEVKKLKYYASIYKRLQSSVRLERIKAQEIWEKVEQSDKQRIKALVANGTL